MENINKRNKLVDELMRLIKAEWDKQKIKFVGEQCVYFNNDFCLSDDKLEQFNSVLDKVAAWSTALAWVKHNVIDDNGTIFRRISQSDGEGNAIFWVDTETIEILIANKDFVKRIIFKCYSSLNDIDGFNNLGELFTYGETNIAHKIVSILDRVYYKRIKE